MPRAATALVLLIAALLWAAPSDALTTPLPGAVAFPSNVQLVLPFPAGSVIRIISGFGPAAGSSLHDGTQETAKANDYYALDLVYDQEPNAGLGLPVLAPLPGTVVKAGWATVGWANYGLRVILEHDLGDGHVYHSLYAHLNAIDPAVVEGATVSVGQPLGELGQSCQGALSCPSFSTPHLHWAIHQDSLIGGSGTGGSYGGHAVVPEPLDGVEDIVQNMTIVSSNTSNPVCGDGFCSPGEDTATCPADCPTCEPIGPTGRIVEQDELCFERSGTPAYWHGEAIGHGGTLLWTTATADAAPDNRGRWSLTFEQAGDYALDVYVEPGFASSAQAAYEVAHDGVTEVVTVDQSAADGFAPLGTFAFAAGGGQSVLLNDNTGEPLADNRVLVFDALRITRIGGPDPGTGGAGGSMTTTGAGGAGQGAAAAEPDAEGGESAGCGCAVPGTTRSASGVAAGIALALLACARRRRRVLA